MAMDSADGDLPHAEDDPLSSEIYSLLQQLEKRGWDGRSGL
jgi:hypothetical protein